MWFRLTSEVYTNVLNRTKEYEAVDGTPGVGTRHWWRGFRTRRPTQCVTSELELGMNLISVTMIWCLSTRFFVYKRQQSMILNLYKQWDVFDRSSLGPRLLHFPPYQQPVFSVRYGVNVHQVGLGVGGLLSSGLGFPWVQHPLKEVDQEEVILVKPLDECTRDLLSPLVAH